MISPLAALIRYHELTTESPSEGTPVRTSEEFRLLQSIPQDLQKRYLRVHKRYNASAVTTLERGICTGCHMRQPAAAPEVAEDVHECQSCGRLLYDPDVAFDYSIN